MDDFRILIVDDELYHRDLIKIRFEHEGLSVNLNIVRAEKEKAYSLKRL